MIPYQDLVAALERWRMRNGLPVGGGGIATPAASYGSAPIAVPRPPASFAPSAPAAKVPLRPQTDEPMDLGDADVLDEDMLNNEGGDFAVAFGGKPPAPAPIYVDDPALDDDAEESTAIGIPGEPPPLSPFGTEPGGSSDTGYDAADDILDESDDPDPRRRS